MKRFNCYIELDSAELIVLMKEEYPNLSRVLAKYSNLKINASKERLKERLSDDQNPLFINFLNDGTENSIPVPFQKELVKYLKEPDRFLEKPNSMLVLDLDEKKLNEISFERGLIAVNSSELGKSFDDRLIGYRYKYFKKNKEVRGQFRSLFNPYPSKIANDKFNLPNSNSIVIYDPYLFANESKYGPVGIENLKILLDALLPSQLAIDFHVTVITNSNSCLWTPKVAKEKLNELKTYCIKKKSYPVELELIISNKKPIHGRYAFSNYYKITFDKGINHFKSESDEIVFNENDLRLEMNFEGIKENNDIPFETSQLLLEDLQNVCRRTYELVRDHKLVEGKIALNTTEKDNVVMNRLLK